MWCELFLLVISSFYAISLSGSREAKKHISWLIYLDVLLTQEVWQDICRWTKSKNMKACTATHTRLPGIWDEHGNSVKDISLLWWLIRAFYIYMGEQHIFPEGEKRVHKEHRTGCFQLACWDIFVWPFKTFHFFSPFSRKCFAAQQNLQELFDF